jgi:hypothetical protein
MTLRSRSSAATSARSVSVIDPGCAQPDSQLKGVIRVASTHSPMSTQSSNRICAR